MAIRVAGGVGLGALGLDGTAFCKAAVSTTHSGAGTAVVVIASLLSVRPHTCTNTILACTVVTAVLGARLELTPSTSPALVATAFALDALARPTAIIDACLVGASDTAEARVADAGAVEALAIARAVSGAAEAAASEATVALFASANATILAFPVARAIKRALGQLAPNSLETIITHARGIDAFAMLAASLRAELDLATRASETFVAQAVTSFEAFTFAVAAARASRVLASWSCKTLFAVTFALGIVVCAVCAVADATVKAVKRKITHASAIDAVAVAVAVRRAVDYLATLAREARRVLGVRSVAQALASGAHTTVGTTAVQRACFLITGIAAESGVALAPEVAAADAVATAVLRAARSIAGLACPWACAVTLATLAETMAGASIRAFAHTAIASSVAVAAVA